ncbi:hypothetical protein DERP_007553 [Dermatophagoides pteronyssinus]|uniref:Uncharacterized protein n=1 Tax=Dermatophagoides pteronyssinus TaxID=6956 RepID=A0ABQ8JK32_DERPT|nr:hypothetical protein DERP_007553 [Dermatophagoides pteronyssinus]
MSKSIFICGSHWATTISTKFVGHNDHYITNKHICNMILLLWIINLILFSSIHTFHNNYVDDQQ